MKHTLYGLLLAISLTVISTVSGTITVKAQGATAQARAILDRTAKKIGKSGGVSASFSMSNPSAGTISGTIAVKGNKFQARTPQTTIWFNGKTQWTYMKKNNEVNISTPTQAQQQMMNPYTFLNIYKSGYNMSATNAGKTQEVHLVAQNQKRSIQEMYITIDPKTSIPSKVKMKHGGKWYSISISNFSSKKLSDAMFSFNSKECPTAELIDLR